jgi:tetratricopeptide (TPR) repeat protein
LLRERPKEAERCLREVVGGDRSIAEAHLLLGHVLCDAGRFEEAAESFEQAITLDAYHGLVSSKVLTEADRPLIARMVARLGAAALPERQRMTLDFAIGKALDDLDDRAAATTHFEAANRIRRRLSSFDRRDFAERVDRLVSSFTPAFFEGHAALGADDETPVLVLGMPRSGTTLVERILSSHPSVAGGESCASGDSRGRVWQKPPSRAGWRSRVGCDETTSGCCAALARPPAA